MRTPWYIRVGDALSQLFNVLLLNGDANESISGRAFRSYVLEHNPKWRFAYTKINKLFSVVEENHCKGAFVADIQRAVNVVNQYSFMIEVNGVDNAD